MKHERRMINYREAKNAKLVLADGRVFKGYGFGAFGHNIAELCFNTAMTGHQEIISDPSYAKQIIIFTFPHVGNVGANEQDQEANSPRASGIVTRMKPTWPSNWRHGSSFENWLVEHNIIGMYGVDTRQLTLELRERGVINALLSHQKWSATDSDLSIVDKIRHWSGLPGLDLAKEVSCASEYSWQQGLWEWPGTFRSFSYGKKIVVLDFGVKENILRCLTQFGCQVCVLPAESKFETIMRKKPNGLLLSNGPGDPTATGEYTLPVIRKILKETKIPIFGICLGHQILALALGAKTLKMDCGHHGANHPVKDLRTNKVEITSMNHGFTVDNKSLPPNVIETHVSLFDGTNCGIEIKDRKVFSVQFHPEASPGPVDSHYLFSKFIRSMETSK